MTTILFDVDDVLADFSSRVLDVVREETGRRHTVEDLTSWSIRDSLDLPAHLWRVVTSRIAEPGFAERLDPYPGAIETVRAIAEHHAVYFVTSPWRSSPTWTHDRTNWLVRWFGKTLGSRVIHTSHKELVAGDVLVEDKPETLAAWERAGGGERQAFLVDRPYNRSTNVSLALRIERLDEMQRWVGGGW